MNKFFYAYDKTIKRRVPHVLVKGYLVSLVTKTTIKYSGSRKKK